MKLAFNLANRAQSLFGLRISAQEFLELEGVSCAAYGGPLAVEGLVSPESFEEVLKSLLTAMVNRDDEQTNLWREVLTKQVGSHTAQRAFERLRDQNAEALATWPWGEPIEWEEKI